MGTSPATTATNRVRTGVPRIDGRRTSAAAVAAVLATALAGCASDAGVGPNRSSGGAALPQGSESVELDPADFTVDVTNKYWPMEKGDRWV